MWCYGARNDERFLKGDLQGYSKWQRIEEDRAPKETGRNDSPTAQRDN